MKKLHRMESQKKNPTFKNLSPNKFPHGMTQLDKMILQSSNSRSVILSPSLRSLNESNEEINQNYNQQNIKASIKCCINHSNKQGSYQVRIDSDIQVFCQKCTILLASQGFKAQKIHKNPLMYISQTKRSYTKSDNMDAIISLADNISKSLGEKKTQLKQTKEQSQFIIYNQYQSMSNYFNKLQAMISYQRNLYMQYLNQEQKKIQSIYSSLQNLLSVSIKDIYKMKRSIYEMEEDVKAGKSISDKLQQCRSQLLICQQISLSWDREDILPRIVFQQSQDLQEVMSLNAIGKIGIGWDRISPTNNIYPNNSINFSFDIQRKQYQGRVRR